MVLHNRHSILSHLQAANITVRWAQLGYAPGEAAAVRDLYRRQDLGTCAGSFTAEVRTTALAAGGRSTAVVSCCRMPRSCSTCASCV